MFEETGYCDEVIITACGEKFCDLTGKKSVVLHGFKEQGSIWYAAYVPGDRMWNVKACDTVPTGRRVSALVAL